MVDQFILSISHSAYLVSLISDHHSEFPKLNPDHSIIPKNAFYGAYAKIDEGYTIVYC